MRLLPAPPPPHLHHRCPELCIPLLRTRHCSRGCDSSFSIIPSPASDASSKASFSHKHPSTSELHTPPLSPISLLQHPCVAKDNQAVKSRARLPCCIPLFPSARLGLPSQQSPLSLPLQHHPLSSSPFSEKSRQAVSFSCKCVHWLGSWVTAVPLEDDPVDEDRRDGRWGAAGETEDCHSEHRWVTTHSTPTIVPSHLFLIADIDIKHRYS